MNTIDMTTGNPRRLILQFAWPLIFGNVFQQMYTFVDTVVVGKALGLEALAALGAVEWMCFFLFGSAQGIMNGFSVILAQRFGAGDESGLRRAVANAGYLSIAGAVILTVGGELAVLPVLRLLGTPAEIMVLAASYIRVLFGGIMITMLYNYLAALLRSLGNHTVPFRAMVLASCSNIAFDIIFVFFFHWGIQGAAYGTIAAQVSAVIYCVFKMRKLPILRFTGNELKADIRMMTGLLKMGVPAGGQNIITSVGGLVVQSVVNSYGAIFMAGYTAANKLYGLMEVAATSYGYAVSAYTGQNMGAGKYARIGEGLKAGGRSSVVTALFMSMIMLLGGRLILRCFLGGDQMEIEQAAEIGYRFLTVLSICFPLLYLLYVIRSCIQGMGNTVIPMASSIIQLIMRTGSAVVLTLLTGYWGVFWGECLAWLGADLFLYTYYLHNMNKKIGSQGFESSS